MASLEGKTLFVTGGSRGIGLAIALRAAQDGANVAIAAKTAEPHPKLPGTIFTAAEDIEKAGGKALPLVVDIREEEMVVDAVEKTVETFGGIDICINNASAIQLTNTPDTAMKRYDLMHQINTRGTFMVSKYCLPHLLEGRQPAYSEPVAAARHEAALVRAARRLHHGQIRHEPVRSRHGGRVQGPGRRGQRPVAAHDHRHRRGQEPARRRADDPGQPDTRTSSPTRPTSS